jgi:hypothetical protein
MCDRVHLKVILTVELLGNQAIGRNFWQAFPLEEVSLDYLSAIKFEGFPVKTNSYKGPLRHKKL